MPAPRHLANAPLREALIDIQLASLLDVSFAKELATHEIFGYEQKNEIRQFSIKLPGPGQATEERAEEPIGRRYESSDGRRVVQFRRNGMTCSILRQYTEWQEIKAAAQAVWDAYRQLSGPISVGRVAVRYINVLDLPPGAELNTYLTAAPQVPQGLPQTLTHFLQRIIVPFPLGILGIITLTLEPALTLPPKTRVILDIDVYAQRTFQADSADMWNFLDHLREVKNDIFFSSVTEQTLEEYR
jgi:uncharacterized protein (TIGR04255 family)